MSRYLAPNTTERTFYASYLSRLTPSEKRDSSKEVRVFKPLINLFNNFTRPQIMQKCLPRKNINIVSCLSRLIHKTYYNR